MIILDTNVLSELGKNVPSPVVVHWFASYPAEELYTTSITAAEISHGIHRVEDSTRRSKLETAMQAMLVQILRGRVLAFDHKAALHFGPIVAGRYRIGRPIEFADAAIAAIAKAHNSPVATRDPDFEGLGLEVINPWAGTSTHPHTSAGI